MAQYCDTCDGSCNNSNRNVSSLGTVTRSRFTGGGALARILHNKYIKDEQLERMDKSDWYRVNVNCLSPSTRLSFVQLGPDEDTERFLNDSTEKSQCVLTQLWHSLVRTLLCGWLITQTSLNGLLGRGTMFVFSTPQLKRLFESTSSESNNHEENREANREENREERRLLDLGAGDGGVTAQMAPFFDSVSVTEMSPLMRRVLAKRGFNVLPVSDWGGNWSMISLLNLLDRCAKPRSLLEEVRQALAPTGRALVAVVLPFRSYVEVGTKDHRPIEELVVTGCTFEEQVESLIANVFEPGGFIVESWTRLPYLCEGDLHQAFYWLTDAVFLLRPTQNQPQVIS